MGSDTAPFPVSAGLPSRSGGLTDSSILPVSPQPTAPQQDTADAAAAFAAGLVGA